MNELLPQQRQEQQQVVPNPNCVYCSKAIEALDGVLSPEDAEKVPKMCPDHFAAGDPNRRYLREPQDPRSICRNCTTSFRLNFRLCHFTNGLIFRLIDNYNRRCLMSMIEAGRRFMLQRPYPDPLWYQAVEIDLSDE